MAICLLRIEVFVLILWISILLSTSSKVDQILENLNRTNTETEKTKAFLDALIAAKEDLEWIDQLHEQYKKNQSVPQQRSLHVPRAYSKFFGRTSKAVPSKNRKHNNGLKLHNKNHLYNFLDNNGDIDYKDFLNKQNPGGANIEINNSNYEQNLFRDAELKLAKRETEKQLPSKKNTNFEQTEHDILGLKNYSPEKEILQEMLFEKHFQNKNSEVTVGYFDINNDNVTVRYKKMVPRHLNATFDSSLGRYLNYVANNNSNPTEKFNHESDKENYVNHFDNPEEKSKTKVFNCAGKTANSTTPKILHDDEIACESTNPPSNSNFEKIIASKVKELSDSAKYNISQTTTSHTRFQIPTISSLTLSNKKENYLNLNVSETESDKKNLNKINLAHTEERQVGENETATQNANKSRRDVANLEVTQLKILSISSASTEFNFAADQHANIETPLSDEANVDYLSIDEDDNIPAPNLKPNNLSSGKTNLRKPVQSKSSMKNNFQIDHDKTPSTLKYNMNNEGDNSILTKTKLNNLETNSKTFSNNVEPTENIPETITDTLSVIGNKKLHEKIKKLSATNVDDSPTNTFEDMKNLYSKNKLSELDSLNEDYLTYDEKPESVSNPKHFRRNDKQDKFHLEKQHHARQMNKLKRTQLSKHMNKPFEKVKHIFNSSNSPTLLKRDLIEGVDNKDVEKEAKKLLEVDQEFNDKTLKHPLVDTDTGNLPKSENAFKVRNTKARNYYGQDKKQQDYENDELVYKEPKNTTVINKRHFPGFEEIQTDILDSDQNDAEFDDFNYIDNTYNNKAAINNIETRDTKATGKNNNLMQIYENTDYEFDSSSNELNNPNDNFRVRNLKFYNSDEELLSKLSPEDKMSILHKSRVHGDDDNNIRTFYATQIDQEKPAGRNNIHKNKISNKYINIPATVPSYTNYTNKKFRSKKSKKSKNRMLVKSRVPDTNKEDIFLFSFPTNENFANISYKLNTSKHKRKNEIQHDVNFQQPIRYSSELKPNEIRRFQSRTLKNYDDMDEMEAKVVSGLDYENGANTGEDKRSLTQKLKNYFGIGNGDISDKDKVHSDYESYSNKYKDANTFLQYKRSPQLYGNLNDEEQELDSNRNERSEKKHKHMHNKNYYEALKEKHEYRRKSDDEYLVNNKGETTTRLNLEQKDDYLSPDYEEDDDCENTTKTTAPCNVTTTTIKTTTKTATAHCDETSKPTTVAPIETTTVLTEKQKSDKAEEEKKEEEACNEYEKDKSIETTPHADFPNECAKLKNVTTSGKRREDIEDEKKKEKLLPETIPEEPTIVNTVPPTNDEISTVADISVTNTHSETIHSLNNTTLVTTEKHTSRKRLVKHSLRIYGGKKKKQGGRRHKNRKSNALHQRIQFSNENFYDVPSQNAQLLHHQRGRYITRNSENDIVRDNQNFQNYDHFGQHITRSGLIPMEEKRWASDQYVKRFRNPHIYSRRITKEGPQSYLSNQYQQIERPIHLRRFSKDPEIRAIKTKRFGKKHPQYIRRYHMNEASNKFGENFRHNYKFSVNPREIQKFDTSDIGDNSINPEMEIKENLTHEQSVEEAAKGEVSQKILESIFDLVESEHKLKGNIAVGLNKLDESPIELEKTETFENEEKQENKKRIEEMLREVMKAINTIVVDEVKEKVCVELPPQLRKFLDWILTKSTPSAQSDEINFHAVNEPIVKSESKKLHQEGYIFDNTHAPPAGQKSLNQTGVEYMQFNDTTANENINANEDDLTCKLDVINKLLNMYSQLPKDDQKKYSKVIDYLECVRDFLNRALSKLRNTRRINLTKRNRRPQKNKHVLQEKELIVNPRRASNISWRKHKHILPVYITTAKSVQRRDEQSSESVTTSTKYKKLIERAIKYRESRSAQGKNSEKRSVTTNKPTIIRKQVDDGFEKAIVFHFDK